MSHKNSTPYSGRRKGGSSVLSPEEIQITQLFMTNKDLLWSEEIKKESPRIKSRSRRRVGEMMMGVVRIFSVFPSFLLHTSIMTARSLMTIM
jgi:hypothetical protein